MISLDLTRDVQRVREHKRHKRPFSEASAPPGR
jgi:hypothetical protein